MCRGQRERQVTGETDREREGGEKWTEKKTDEVREKETRREEDGDRERKRKRGR